MSSSDLIVKAKEYAKNKYASVLDEISRHSQADLVAVSGQLAARGLGRSGPMAKAIGDNRAEMVKKLIQARVDALLDGFELYEVPITEELATFIIQEATAVCTGQVSNAVRTSFAGDMHHISGNIVKNVSVPIASIRCQIEERRMRPKTPAQQPNVTNVYHISGPNSRVNVQSTDQSVNSVTISSEQVFQKIRETIQSGVPSGEQTEILQRLEALEKAQNTTYFGVCYTDFIAAAANHMTLIAPFIPALSELLRKLL